MKPTIEILEGEVWPVPEFESSLVLTAHALRRKPIDELTPNDLRVAFTQDVGAGFLKARVLDILEEDPTTGDLFEGDLLLAVMSSPLFRSDEEFKKKITTYADRALIMISDLGTRDEIRNLRG
ncbi:MAG: contact-dependent growth inhibition system immunity protein [Verrucomicrobiota bacterium]